ncbi:maltose 6'-phosphate phosphatase [Clostridium cavendishii DSM 21758]|uniref:Maltose 6'-phosphate phosphatase n=1 Tax=Clostridium cavendishii DSM 21758 TaxID=1121302 RepID=A0A1M6H266_9CLOT|nr:endonuclease/exonuclease/phosphatase family protein [Clostridium cavendishii]SHJ16289.1 maltose 6'-phosphate phosphatase [Clostridium cavendishii DSM 21758]
MKLLTLNCHSWMEENQYEKLKHIAKTIVENEYDVIALQEVSQLIKSDVKFENIKEKNFVIKLLEEIQNLGNTEYSFVWDYSHIGYENYEEGVAILTKHRITKKESFFISKGKDQTYWKTRKIVKCEISYNGDFIDIYSCHLGWWKDSEEPFEYQCDRLIETMDNKKLNIFMGDFNNSAFVKDEGYDYIIKNGLYDSYNMAKNKDRGVTLIGEAAGWDENKDELRIDLILVNKELKVKSSYTIFNGSNKDVVSDHYGVEVELDL